MASGAPLLLLVAGLARAGEPAPTMDLVMPGARPLTDDSYICSSFDVSNMTGGGSTVHVTGFVPHAKANRAHHMLLYSCGEPNQQPGVVFDCLHHSMCRGGQSIMFAWAKNAPATTLPEDVSFTVDPSKNKYLVLQIHYAHPLPDADHTGLSLKYQRAETRYRAGILLMMLGGIVIPANTAVTHGDINCPLPSPTPIHMFGYRTHAHGLGTVITGYVYNEEGHKYRQIAAGSPQWPQAFYPMKQLNTVKPGEVVTARCTYNSTGVDHNTYIGSTAGDEMCNLYIMFFTEAALSPGDFLGCSGEQAGHDITRGLPSDSDKVPEKRPEMEAQAHSGSAVGGPKEINYAALFEKELSMGTSKKKVLDGPHTVTYATINMTMPGVTPTQDDDYLCTGVPIQDFSTKAIYVTSFKALGQEGSRVRAHHMILSKCRQPKKRGYGETWDCRHHAMCDDSSKILFAWAKHAKPTELPDGVGFALHPDEYLVLQVHYAKPQTRDHSGIAITVEQTPPTYTAGMFLLLRSNLNIPPETPAVHGDVNCRAKIRSPIHVFAYRTHAHSLGSVISGYRYSPGDAAGEWKLVAKGNPNWPQAFYPMDQQLVVNPGDVLAARCTYNTVGHSTPTRIGSTGGDEMCNLYLMYYTVSPEDEFIVCADEEDPSLTSRLPAGSDTPPPPRPDLEETAQGESDTDTTFSNGGTSHRFYPAPVKKGGGASVKRPGVADIGDGGMDTDTNTGGGLDMGPDIGGGLDPAMLPRSAAYGGGPYGGYPGTGRQYPQYQPQYQPLPGYQQQPPQYQLGPQYRPAQLPAQPEPPAETKQKPSRKRNKAKNPGSREPKALPSSGLTADPSWPAPATAAALGQLSGVSIDTYGNAVIFHRGDRTWTGQTFNNDNTYGLDRSVPIPQETVLTVNASGHVINSWGHGIFFLPHMITVDRQNNVWVTDVALHQVFKFGPYGGGEGSPKPLIALGTRFQPGSDDKHFCKPTSVAVSNDGNTFFVSDGYCNSRVIKYQVVVDGSGKHQVTKVLEWGKGAGPFTLKPADFNFNIPHGLALAEDRGEVCVADRENGRVQCFDLEGKFVRSIKPAEFGARIFSVAYTPANGGQLHAVSGPEFSLNPWVRKPTGYVVSLDSGALTGSWNVPGGLQNPHDVAVSEDGNTVYVCELNPFKVWRLTNGAPSAGPSPLPGALPKTGASPADTLLPDLHMSSSVLAAAAISLPLSILLAACLAWRRCRKRGRGQGGGGAKAKEWGVGDLLGRSKDGFKPLNTDERDGMLDDDSDSEVEEFSIPANHA